MRSVGVNQPQQQPYPQGSPVFQHHTPQQQSRVIQMVPLQQPGLQSPQQQPQHFMVNFPSPQTQPLHGAAQQAFAPLPSLAAPQPQQQQQQPQPQQLQPMMQQQQQQPAQQQQQYAPQQQMCTQQPVQIANYVTSGGVQPLGAIGVMHVAPGGNSVALPLSPHTSAVSPTSSSLQAQQNPGPYSLPPSQMQHQQVPPPQQQRPRQHSCLSSVPSCSVIASASTPTDSCLMTPPADSLNIVFAATPGSPCTSSPSSPSPGRIVGLVSPTRDDTMDFDEDELVYMPPSMTRPCEHNDWDDVRTRKGSKILRCRTCQRKWKLPSSHVPRCMTFLRGNCHDERCQLLHVHKKKSSLTERYGKFGDAVLRAAVPPKQQKSPGGVSVSPHTSPASLTRIVSHTPLTPSLVPVAVSPGLGPDSTSASVSPVFSTDARERETDFGLRRCSGSLLSEPPSLLTPSQTARVSLVSSDFSIGYDSCDRRPSLLSTSMTSALGVHRRASERSLSMSENPPSAEGSFVRGTRNASPTVVALTGDSLGAMSPALSLMSTCSSHAGAHKALATAAAAAAAAEAAEAAEEEYCDEDEEEEETDSEDAASGHKAAPQKRRENEGVYAMNDEELNKMLEQHFGGEQKGKGKKARAKKVAAAAAAAAAAASAAAAAAAPKPLGDCEIVVPS